MTPKALERSLKIGSERRDPLQSQRMQRENTRQIIKNKQLVLYSSRDNEDIFFWIVSDEAATTFYIKFWFQRYLHTLILCWKQRLFSSCSFPIVCKICCRPKWLQSKQRRSDTHYDQRILLNVYPGNSASHDLLNPYRSPCILIKWPQANNSI